MYTYHKVIVRLPIVSFYYVFLNRNFNVLSCCIILTLVINITINKYIHMAVNLCMCRYLFEPQHDTLTTLSGVKGLPHCPESPQLPLHSLFYKNIFSLIFRIYYFKFSKGVRGSMCP